MAEHAGHGEQTDRPSVGFLPGPADERLDLRAQRCAGAIAIVAIMEGKEVEAVAREEPAASRDPVDLVEVEQALEQAVAQTVPTRAEPAVKDLTRVDGRLHAAAALFGARHIAGSIANRPLGSSTVHGRCAPSISV